MTCDMWRKQEKVVKSDGGDGSVDITNCIGQGLFNYIYEYLCKVIWLINFVSESTEESRYIMRLR